MGSAGHISWTLDYPNLAVLRTFSKLAGLAGLRVGYVPGAGDDAGAVAGAVARARRFRRGGLRAGPCPAVRGEGPPAAVGLSGIRPSATALLALPILLAYLFVVRDLGRAHVKIRDLGSGSSLSCFFGKVISTTSQPPEVVTVRTSRTAPQGAARSRPRQDLLHLARIAFEGIVFCTGSDDPDIVHFGMVIHQEATSVQNVSETDSLKCTILLPRKHEKILDNGA
jgi:hypothetical protein